MEITSEDIRAIQRKLDSLKKVKTSASKKLATERSKSADKLESDVYDSENFFDED